MSSEKALIAAIGVAPDSREPWLAYRDWLVERGDPRGSWIRAALEGDDEVTRRPPVSDEELMTPRLYAQSHLLFLGWWRGFIRTAGLTGAMDDPPTFETLEALFADPHAALLASLKLTHPIMETVPLWEPVFASVRPSITSLYINELGPGVAQLASNLPRLSLLAIGGMFAGGRPQRPFDPTCAPVTTSSILACATSRPHQRHVLH